MADWTHAAPLHITVLLFHLIHDDLMPSCARSCWKRAQQTCYDRRILCPALCNGGQETTDNTHPGDSLHRILRAGSDAFLDLGNGGCGRLCSCCIREVLEGVMRLGRRQACLRGVKNAKTYIHWHNVFGTCVFFCQIDTGTFKFRAHGGCGCRTLPADQWVTSVEDDVKALQSL